MAKIARLLDLETNFAFHGAYHSNPVNVIIHALFIWPIFFTFLMMFYFTPVMFDVSGFRWFSDHGLLLNFGFFFTLTYALFYVALDKKAGTLAALLCFACWVGASFLSASLGFSKAWRVVVATQLVCWASQVVGHGMFEKRSPPIVENLSQALLTVPFFVLLEVLKTFFGYEPYPGFHASVQAKIEAEKKEWRDKKQKKST